MIVKQAEVQTGYDQDPVEQALKKTGCIELHYQIQECIAETRDWRKCQDLVQKFKVCMEEYKLMPNLFRVLPAASYKMVIVVRTDISMGTGKIAAQCAHAAVECYRNTPINPMKQYMFRSWLYNGQPKVVLQVSSEYKLLELEQNAKKIGLVTAVIKDAGRTQLKPGTISVLGIGPDLSTEVNRVTSHLQLL